jgi:hypothetical protein
MAEIKIKSTFHPEVRVEGPKRIPTMAELTQYWDSGGRIFLDRYLRIVEIKNKIM